MNRKPAWFSKLTREDQLDTFIAWLPRDLRNAPGIDWASLSSQVAGYLVTKVASSPDAAYLAIAAASAMDSMSNASLLSMLHALNTLLSTLRMLSAMKDIADLHRADIWHGFVARSPMPAYRSAQLSAYASVTTTHFPAYLERLSPEERQRMQCYALPTVDPVVLKQLRRLARLEAPGKHFRQQKKQQAKTYITQQCRENPDITCQELLDGLKSAGIRMSNKSVNSMRRELGLPRPSGSVAQHLRSSRVHDQARQWLVAQRRADPDVRVHVLLAGLHDHFDIVISTRQLNNILGKLGVARPSSHRAARISERQTIASDVEAQA